MLECARSSATGDGFEHIGARSGSANVFRVSGNGTTFNVNGTFTTGADYAEYFEWEDGNASNEDRRGNPVVLVGEKIRVADTNDDPYDIIGVISTNPSAVGDSAWNEWKQMYLKDKYGQRLTQRVYYHANVSAMEDMVPCSENDVPPTGYVSRVIDEAVLNPAYNPSLGYTSRTERSEWAAVGLCGKVRIDNSFVTANIVHPRWKALRVFDDHLDPGNSAAQVVEMLVRA